MKGQKTLFSCKSDEWGTPQIFFDKLNEQYHFSLDPCATKENAKCKRFYTLADNGLTLSWKGERVFCNPPYSRISDWVKKAASYINQRDETLTVMLVPVRTDTIWFHNHIWSEENKRPYTGIDVNFIRGRLKFEDGTPSKNCAPFPSMLIIFK